MELSYVALDTGLRRGCSPDGESEETGLQLRDWLLDLVWSQRLDDLPPAWPGYRANATDFGGGLVLTVYGPLATAAVLTIGVARRASHGSPLWRVLTALPRALPGLPPPRTPWVAVLDPGADLSVHALQDFVLACAWVWVQRPLAPRRANPRALAGASRGTLEDRGTE